MAVFCPLSTTPVFWRGTPHVGAYIRFYDAGTNTPRAVYSNGELTTVYDAANIRTDANGCVPNIWVQGNPYKVKITSSTGEVIRTIDNIPGDVAAVGGGGGGGGGGGAAIPVGMISDFYGSGTIDGWVRCNGRTIGNASSGATEWASADASALFAHLYNSDPTLAVSGGRTTSAATDFAANKTIALPDMRGRVTVGLDDMGASAAGRLSGLTFTAGNATTLGSTVGAATHTLATSEIPAHTHTASTNTVADHAHVGSTATAGGHTPTGTIASSGAHTHGTTVSTATDHTHAIANPTTTSAPIGAGAGIAWAGTQSVSTGAGGAHTHTVTVASDGAHTHTLTMDAVSDHTHSVTVSPAGSHAHTVTVDSAGSGGAHANVQPSILVTKYIKA